MMYNHTNEHLAAVALHAPLQPYSVLPRLKRYFKSYANALKAGPSGWKRAGVGEEHVRAIEEYGRNLSGVMKIIEDKCIRILLPGDPEYPNLLNEIHDPPSVLYARGTIPISNTVSIVGSRNHTAYGAQAARELAAEAAMIGVSTVSGLARGIDGIVHAATVEAGGKTIGILGSGVDRMYPSQHLRLAEDILTSGGAVVSEFPIGTPPLPYHFPRRNRLIAGISPLTVVVEGEKKGGAMLTARTANDSGRDVWALPGDIYRKSSEGPNDMIAQGAQALCGVNQLREYFQLDILKAEEFGMGETEERVIARAFDRQGTHLDVAARRLRLDIATLSSKVILVELQGWIRHDGGGVYRRIL